jgi:alkanesulfonate monooxygenase SsuD/methylene tetrahydromethanopterin reductase-like flavin-dependent oxidoreductase (luciferase family)
VAESDAAAKAECKDAYDLYVDTRLYAKKHVYEDIIANGICLFGAVETVAEKMCRLHEMGIRHVAILNNFGAMAPAVVERSMQRFAREVMPAVARRLGMKKAAE